jgi:hypothetical protein
VTPQGRKNPTFAAIAAQAKIAPRFEDVWDVKYFQRHPDDDAARRCPGRDYLRDCPPSVAAFFSVVIVQVADAPPTKFGGGGYWEAMHGEMTGYFEVRKRHRGMHYRLFCILDEASQGTKPLLTVLCGMTKRDRTVFSDAEYLEVRALGDEYLARNPRSIA